MCLIVILLFVSVNLAHLVMAENRKNINVTDLNVKYEETLNLNDVLVIKILELGRNDFEDKCTASCIEVESKIKNTLNCYIFRREDNTKLQYLDAFKNVDKSFDGNWNCTFIMVRQEKKNGGSPLHVKFKFHIKNPTTTTTASTASVTTTSATSVPSNAPDGFNWMYVYLPIGIIAVLIIIAQALCIVRIWLKAKARTQLANLRANQARAETPDNTVRYTTTPTQVKLEKNIPRESVIYEALENLPPSKPVPPPIDTLPRPVKNEGLSEHTLERSRMPTLPMGRMLPLTPPKVKKDDNVSMSSIDRIKNRAPLPLPTEEPIEYEVMTPTMTTPPGYFRPPIANKVKSLIPPGMPPQVVPNFTAGPSQGQVLPSMIAAAQLKPVNKPTPWNQAQRMPTLETNAFGPRNNTQTGLTHVPSFNRSGPPPVMNKPPRPLPVQSIPTPDKYAESSDEEEWTYEPLHHYDDYNGSNIYDNIPR